LGIPLYSDFLWFISAGNENKLIDNLLSDQFALRYDACKILKKWFAGLFPLLQKYKPQLNALQNER